MHNNRSINRLRRHELRGHELRGQTLFSVFKNLASGAFGVRYPHSVINLIRRAEATIDQSANVASPIPSYILTNSYRKPKTVPDPNDAPPNDAPLRGG